MSLCHAVLKAVRRRQGQRRLGGGPRGRHVAPVLGEEGGKEVGRHQAGRCSPCWAGELVCPHCWAWSAAQDPQDHRAIEAVVHARRLLMREEEGRELWEVTEAPTVLQMGPGGDRVAPIEGDQPQVQCALLHQRRVVLVGRELAALLAHLARPAHLGPGS